MFARNCFYVANENGLKCLKDELKDEQYSQVHKEMKILNIKMPFMLMIVDIANSTDYLLEYDFLQIGNLINVDGINCSSINASDDNEYCTMYTKFDIVCNIPSTSVVSLINDCCSDLIYKGNIKDLSYGHWYDYGSKKKATTVKTDGTRSDE